MSGVRASSMRMLSTSSTIAKLTGIGLPSWTPPCWTFVQRRGHVVAQVVEAELGVRAVGDVGLVGRLLLLGGLHVLQDADGDAERVVDRAHPLGVAAGEVVVDGDDVDALARERVEARRRACRERLALAGLHLGDVAAVQDHAADELHVEVAHAHRALAGLADDGERLGEQVVERLAALRALAQRGHALAQLVVGLELELGLVGVDPRDALLVLPELLRLADVQRTVKKAHDGQRSSGSAPVRRPLRSRERRLPNALRRGRADGRRVALAPPAALVAVALDLARSSSSQRLIGVAHVAPAVLRAERHALEVQGGLDDLRIGDRRVALLGSSTSRTARSDTWRSTFREALLDVLAQLVGDGGVATLDLDLHGDPLVGDVAGHTVEPGAPPISTDWHERRARA